jgi:sporulation protein YlmC with PRC-barrel domain
MKKVMITAPALLLALAFGPGTVSGYGDAGGQRFDVPRQEQHQVEQQQIGELHAAERMIGQNVESPQGQNLGRVRELVMDAETGQVGYAVISAQDVTGIQRDYLVPWAALQFDHRAETFVLDISPEELREAPTARVIISPDDAEAIHEFYGVAPVWVEDEVVEMRPEQEPFPWETPSGLIETLPDDFGLVEN